MAQKNRAMALLKVKDLIENLSKMGVWGNITLCFENGEVTKLVDNLIWTAQEADGDMIAPVEEIKKCAHVSTTRKKLVIRTGAGNGNLS